MTTMREVAQIAGTSAAAVSRYLNGGYVAEEKRERIRAAIEQTGYMPSAQARALRTGKANLVGVVVPKINSESISRITSGVSKVLRDRGYQMLFANTENDPEVELQYLELFRRHPVDGIVLVGTVVTPRHQAFLRECEVPVVVVGQHVEQANCVYHDDFGAAHELASRVAAAFGPRVAYVGVTREDVAAGASRQDGLVRGLAEAGAPFDEALLRTSPFTVEGGYEATHDLLGAHDDVDCVCCATDTIAAGAIRAISERFGDAEARPAVTGFGDNEFLRSVTGGIPTVHFGYKTSGMKATEMLMGILSGDTTVGMQLQLGYEVVGL